MTETFNFEGDEVSNFTAQLPSIGLDAPEAYPRGTLLNLTVQVRVKSVRLEEDRKGALSRKHVLALEDVAIVDVLTPDQRRALIEQAQQLTDQPVTPSAAYTVPEETLSEDVIPGQITNVVAVAAADAEASPTEVHVDAREGIPAEDYDAEGYFIGTKYVLPQEPVTVISVDPDDDDHEHDWMDADSLGGLQVHVDF